MDYLPAVKVLLKIPGIPLPGILKAVAKILNPFPLSGSILYTVSQSQKVSVQGPEISGSPSRIQSLCCQRAATSVLRGQAPGKSWDHKRCLKTTILLARWVVLNRVPTPSDSWQGPKLVPGHHVLSMPIPFIFKTSQWE